MDESQRDLREKLIDQETYNDMLRDWVRLNSTMRRSGSSMIQWDGQLPEIGSDVCAFGGIGVVCDYSLQETDGQFERCLWIKVGGEFLKTISKEISEVTKEKRQKQNEEFKERLIAAGKKVETQRKERRARAVKGSHLVDDMMAATTEYTVDKKSSFYKVTGKQKGRAVYVFVKGGRVDLSGFTTDNIAVTKMSEEEAKNKHLGRVRGQINFSHPDTVVMDSFKAVLKELL